MTCDICRTPLSNACAVFVVAAAHSTRWLCDLCADGVVNFLARLVDAQKELRPL